MTDTLCRLAVQTAGPGGSTAMDLVLPADRPLGELVPSIVDAVFTETPGPRHWQLTRIGGHRLEPSLSLRDNAVADGDLVLLTELVLPSPRPLPTEDSVLVAAGSPADDPDSGRRARIAAAVAGISASALAAVWAGHVSPAPWQVWPVAAVSAAAAIGSVAAPRDDRGSTAVLSCTAVLFATATGFLAAPRAPWVTLLLLACASGFTMSVLLARMTPHRTLLTGLAATTGVSAAAVVLGAAVPRPESVAAALTVLALGALAVAPKGAVLAAGLTPDGRRADDDRATAAHDTLTGLVNGWSAAAAAGCVAATAITLFTRGPANPALALSTSLGVALVLRRRVHVGAHRRIATGAAGLAALAAGAVLLVAAMPAQAVWMCAAAATVCTLAITSAGLARSLNPLRRRLIQFLEYAALAAVVPSACWVADIYGAVRTLSLP
ncbi:type VII secretion integral membrane protein EccD [Mycobacterium sp. smrl_JER01]|uniref:type VII secretion integral membrane protein EccD n=1 Tax=Mycobacterium sp. smrl_JER01 TaxID=3402633 RepID=UPI003D744F99